MQLFRQILLITAICYTAFTSFGQLTSNPHQNRSVFNQSLIGLDTNNQVLYNLQFSDSPGYGLIMRNDFQYIKNLKRINGALGVHLGQTQFSGQTFFALKNSSSLTLTYNHVLRETSNLTWTGGLSFKQYLVTYQPTTNRSPRLGAELPKINTALQYKNFYGGISLGFVGFSQGPFGSNKWTIRSNIDLSLGYDFKLGNDFTFNLLAENRTFGSELPFYRTSGITLKATYKDKIWLSGSIFPLQSHAISAGYNFKNGLGVGIGYSYTKSVSNGDNPPQLGLQLKWSF